MAEASLTERQFRAISAIADAMNSGAGWKSVLDGILRGLIAEMGYKAASVRELDAEQRTLSLTHSVGLSEEYLRKGAVELEKSALDRDALQGEVVDISDVRNHRGIQYPTAVLTEGIGSFLVAPLTVRDRVIGVLRVYSPAARVAGEPEKLFLSAVARLVASAMMGAQRYEVLGNISREIGGSLDLQKVLAAILNRTVRDMNYKGGVIRLLDPTGKKLELMAATGVGQAYLNKGEVAVEHSAIDRVVLEGRSFTIYDVATESAYQYPREALNEGIRSVQAVPLSVTDHSTGERRVIGVLRIYSAQPRRFSEDEISFLQIIANLGAIAIENARLYDELGRRVQSLQPDEEGWYRVDDA